MLVDATVAVDRECCCGQTTLSLLGPRISSPRARARRYRLPLTSFGIQYFTEPYEETEPATNWFDALQLNDNDKRKIGRTNAIKLFKLKLPLDVEPDA